MNYYGNKVCTLLTYGNGNTPHNAQYTIHSGQFTKHDDALCLYEDILVSKWRHARQNTGYRIQNTEYRR